MPRRGPPRLPAGERDHRLAEEVLYLHSLWRRGGPVPAPAPAPIQFRSTRHEERDPRGGLHRVLRRREHERLTLCRLLGGNGRKRRRIDPAAAAAGAPTLPTANPPAPTTPLGSLAQREADDDDEGSGSDGDKAVEEEAARYFTGLFERDASLRGHYTERWHKGRFQCLVCAAGGGKTVVGKRVRRFRGCLALVRHLREASRARSRYWNHRKRGAHRGLGVVVCRMFGWDFDNPRVKAGVQHAKKEEEDSTDDGSYSIDEDEESEDEESEGEEEDIETWMLPDPGTDGDEEDSEMESNDEEYAEKEDADIVAEGSKITDDDKDAIELDNSENIPEKEAANSIARKQDMKIRDCLLRLTHAKSVNTTPKETDVRKTSHVPKHKEVSTPGSKFNEGSDTAKRKVSILSYQGLKSINSGVVNKMKVNQQPSNKGKQSETNETRASARKAKRLAKKQLSKKQLAKKAKKQLAKKRKVDAKTLENTHRS